MQCYLVSYDLRAPGRDYSSLHSHLKQYSLWAKPLESVWLIKASLTVEQVRNQITAYLDQNDRLLVIDVTRRAAAWTNLLPDIVNWIKNNL